MKKEQDRTKIKTVITYIGVIHGVKAFKNSCIIHSTKVLEVLLCTWHCSRHWECTDEQTDKTLVFRVYLYSSVNRE